MSRLQSLSVLSSSDAWAVGDTAKVLLHWNGTSWIPVTIPGQSGGSTGLYGVDAVSPSNVWAVGVSADKALIVRWNGTSWTWAPEALPRPAGVPAAHVWFSAVDAASATDMWIAGGYSRPSGSSNQIKNLAWHWNGSNWAMTPVPTAVYTGSPVTSTLLGVAAVSPTDAWIVGGGDAPHHTQPVSMHWNGTSWTQVAAPNPGHQGAVLTGVAAAGSGNVWAAGSYYGGFRGSVSRALILHWNGSAWVRS